MNLVVALLVLTGSGLATYVGLTDPPGGVLGAVGRALRGERQPTRKAPPTAAELIGSNGGGGATSTGSPTASGTRSALVAEAQAQLGKWYKWAGNGPDVFDCSGLTKWCYAKVGIAIPRTAAQQQVMAKGRVVRLEQCKPGDLVFYGSPARHVALYIGNGQVISAPRTGKQVEIVAANMAGYPTKITSCRNVLGD